MRKETVSQVQASPSGESISYFSVVPFAGLLAGSEFPTYLSTRGGGGWSTQGLLAPTFPSGVSNVIGLTADDAYTIVFVPREGGRCWRLALKLNVTTSTFTTTLPGNTGFFPRVPFSNSRTPA